MTRFFIPLLAGLAISLIALGLIAWQAGGFADSASLNGETESTMPIRIERQAPETASLPDRLVEAPGVTPGPVVNGPLIRLSHRASAKPISAAPREILFRRVIVTSAGTFRAIHQRKAISIKLDGIIAPAFNARCQDEHGVLWACGAQARTALARLIRGRSVLCLPGEPIESTSLVARCRIGHFDLAEWLVEQGWAVPMLNAQAELFKKADLARSARRGRYKAAADPS